LLILEVKEQRTSNGASNTPLNAYRNWFSKVHFCNCNWVASNRCTIKLVIVHSKMKTFYQILDRTFALFSSNFK